ncbi:MAG: glycosyltransferase family 8 protein [Neisseria sp.]|nr:glycosyltransferase family 8 protein [Neisseria sp.]
MSNRISIAFAADFRYADAVQTALKSICAHNQSIDFYLLNKDFPQEWLEIINRHLANFDSVLHDKKIKTQGLDKLPTLKHINSESTFYRLFLAELLPKELDKVLYLDADLIATGDLRPLFDLNLDDFPLAAVIDPFARDIHQRQEFNAGVLLINLTLWRQIQFAQHAISLLKPEKALNDQDVLNAYFKKNYLELNRGFNYQVGGDALYPYAKLEHLLEDLGEQVPLIIHYTTEAKPWHTHLKTRFRDLYWQYYALSWQEIAENVAKKP